MSITEEIIDIPAEHIRNVFGEFDHYIKNIERALNVTIIARGGSLKIIGEAGKTSRRPMDRRIIFAISGRR